MVAVGGSAAGGEQADGHGQARHHCCKFGDHMPSPDELMPSGCAQPIAAEFENSVQFYSIAGIPVPAVSCW